jgi:hypothetical protein
MTYEVTVHIPGTRKFTVKADSAAEAKRKAEEKSPVANCRKTAKKI